MTVSDGYVREPASDDVAAAYFTIRKRWLSGGDAGVVVSGAARTVSVHDLPGSPGHHESGPLVIEAGTTVSLAPGQGHVMLEDAVAPLLPGQWVSLMLRFDGADPVLLAVPVIPIGAEPPGGRK